MNFHKLANLFPLLPEAELSLLAEDIKTNGLHNPIWTYEGDIIDGRNRYLACERVGVFPEFKEYNGSEDDLLNFVISLNLKRRQLNASQLALVALDIEAYEAEKAKARKLSNLVQNTDTALVPQREELGSARKKAAETVGVSERYVQDAKKIKAEAPQLLEGIQRGDMSVKEAMKEIKIAERKEKIQEQREEIERGSVEVLDGLFDVLAVDPPWAYGREYDPETSRVANPYPEMTQAQLLEIELPAKDDAVLFLWTTHQFIFDAKELLDKWGFTYKATIVWNKQKIGMGSWFRMQCEFCLVGIKGKPFWQNTEHRDIIEEPRRQHSRKPDAFYELVEKITAGRKVDFFSRESREGWESYGNDTNKF